MAYAINLKTITDDRGSLTVVEKVLPFDIKRVYFIYGVGNNSRGEHRHHSCVEALVCVSGSCDVYVNDGKKERVFNLNSHSKCLVLQPVDWRKMSGFTKDAVLLVLSSECYNKDGYINEKYGD
ncbi:MAG TPA: WxcM-like domain-containing protein [bacterium]|nr:WxcM-like domain-containing protein [bacterium]